MTAGHIIDQPGAARTLCGARAAEVGITWARYVQAHIDGHDPEWCPECFALWRGTLLQDGATPTVRSMTMDTEPPIAVGVGWRLREARERLNLSRKDAAERHKAIRARRGLKGLSHVAIGHYETAYRVPSLETLLELAEAYEVALADLLPRPRSDGGKGPSTDITLRVRGYSDQAELEDALVGRAAELGAEAHVVQSSIPYAIPEGT